MKDVERTKAKELFGTFEEPSALASKIMGTKSRTFDIPGTTTALNEKGGIRVKLTEKEKLKFQELIKNAKSLDEIAKLEKMFAEGKIPGM